MEKKKVSIGGIDIMSEGQAPNVQQLALDTASSERVDDNKKKLDQQSLDGDFHPTANIMITQQHTKDERKKSRKGKNKKDLDKIKNIIASTEDVLQSSQRTFNSQSSINSSRESSLNRNISDKNKIKVEHNIKQVDPSKFKKRKPRETVNISPQALRALGPSKLGQDATHFSVREIIHMGSEIMQKIEEQPQSHRIGNIYYQIQEKIDKKAHELGIGQAFITQKNNSKEKWFVAKRTKVSEVDSEDQPLNSKDVMLQKAEWLDKMIKEDPSISINQELVYDKDLDSYMAKQGLKPREKFGDIVVANNNAEQIINMVNKHYRAVKDPLKAKKQVRELRSVFQGKYDKEYGRDISKSVGPAKSARTRNSPQPFYFNFASNSTLEPQIQTDVSLHNYRRTSMSPMSNALPCIYGNGTEVCNPPHSLCQPAESLTNIKSRNIGRTLNTIQSKKKKGGLSHPFSARSMGSKKISFSQPSQKQSVSPGHMSPANLQDMIRNHCNSIQEVKEPDSIKKTRVPSKTTFMGSRVSDSSVEQVVVNDQGLLNINTNPDASDDVPPGSFPAISPNQTAVMSLQTLESPQSMDVIDSGFVNSQPFLMSPMSQMQIEGEDKGNQKTKSIMQAIGQEVWDKRIGKDTYERLALPVIKQKLALKEQKRHTKLNLTTNESILLLNKLESQDLIESIRNKDSPPKKERIPNVPSFIESIFVKDHENPDNVLLANDTQFEQINKMFSDFYEIEEPKNYKFIQLRNLQKRLQQKKVLKVNSIENEHDKIKKDNGGRGAALTDNQISTNDHSMQLFTKYLNRMLVGANRHDKYLSMKHQAFLQKQEELQKRKQTLAAVKQINKLRVDYDPTVGNQIIEQQVSKLHASLKKIIKLSPHKKLAAKKFKAKPPNIDNLEQAYARQNDEIMFERSDMSPNSSEYSEDDEQSPGFQIGATDDSRGFPYIDDASKISRDSPLRGTNLKEKLARLKRRQDDFDVFNSTQNTFKKRMNIHQIQLKQIVPEEESPSRTQNKFPRKSNVGSFKSIGVLNNRNARVSLKRKTLSKRRETMDTSFPGRNSSLGFNAKFQATQQASPGKAGFVAN